ncbi:MAG: hypothetical protein PSV24_08055 [Rhodoferax sp.]|nr:hypothetical protein [Rhodoferax sp.]
MTSTNQSTSTIGSESCNTMNVLEGRHGDRVTFTLPAMWASYLINRDVSSFWFEVGGSQSVTDVIDQWMAREGLGACLSCSEHAFFAWLPDFPHQQWATCLEFTFSLALRNNNK